jgi:hypothetical protein
LVAVLVAATTTTAVGTMTMMTTSAGVGMVGAAGDGAMTTTTTRRSLRLQLRCVSQLRTNGLMVERPAAGVMPWRTAARVPLPPAAARASYLVRRCPLRLR